LYGSQTRTLRKIDHKIWNVALEKNGEEHLDRSCNKTASFVLNQGETSALYGRIITGRKPDWIVSIFIGNVL